MNMPYVNIILDYVLGWIIAPKNTSYDIVCQKGSVIVIMKDNKNSRGLLGKNRNVLETTYI